MEKINGREFEIEKSRVAWNKLNLDSSKILDLYNKNKSISEISRILGCSITPIKRIIHANEVYIRNPGFYRKEKNPSNKQFPNKREVIELYKNTPIKKIAKLLSYDERAIKRVLVENNIEIKPTSFFTKGKSTWIKGLTKENNGVVKKMALDKMGNNFGFKKGKAHLFFNNYSSLLPYGPEFNKVFKNAIILRDNNCLICGSNNQLSVHHINYNKLQSSKENCICLCRSCHAKTNFNRKQWQTFFKSLLSEKYGYEYYNDKKIKIQLNAEAVISDKAKQEVN